ncbi:MAG TPA: hypothetical protein VGL89_18210 [Candidatus Koribacter sp.]|jgi:hypothetical protein
MARQKEPDYEPEPTPICGHIKPNGVQCGCVAVSGERFCYFHAAARDRHIRQLRYMRNTNQPLMIPLLESPEAIQVAIHEVTTALLYERIDMEKAKFLLRALLLASKNIGKCDFDCEDTCPVFDSAEQDEIEEAATDALDESSFAGQMRNLNTERYAQQAKESARQAEQALEAVRALNPNLAEKKPAESAVTKDLTGARPKAG